MIRSFKSAIAGLIALVAIPCAAYAQTSPNFTFGQVPTPAQWNAAFAGKQDVFASTPCLTIGCTFTGGIITAPSATYSAGINLPPGTAPTLPIDGDLWTTTAGLYARINGSTIGPLGTAACPTCAVTNATNTFTAAQIINLNSATLPAAQTGTALQIGGAAGTTVRAELDAFAATPRFTCVRTDGTIAAKTTLQSGDEICSLNAFGYNGSAVVGPQAAIRTYAAQNWVAGSALGTNMRLGVTANGATALTDALGIEQDGGITAGSLIGTSMGAGNFNALGYYVSGTKVATSASTPIVLTAGVLTCPTCATVPGGPTTIGDIAIFSSTSGVVGDAGGGIPNLPLVHPSSGNNFGAGCNGTAHQAWWVDQNLCSTADVLQVVSNDPSALAVFTLGGTPVSGHVYTFNLIYGGTTKTVTYTVQPGDGLNNVTAGLVCAIASNTTLFNLNGGSCSGGVITPATPTTSYGGYAGGKQIGYTVINTNTSFAFDYNSANDMQMSYSVSGGGTETITSPAGWFSGTLYSAGTSTGSANAQVIAASGFTLAAGKSINFTAGFSNSGAATLNAQSTGAVAIQKYVNGALTALTGGEIAAGTNYTVAYNGSTYTLNLNAVHVAGGSTASTNYQLPNAFDNNPALVTGRGPGGIPPAPGSAIFALYATGAQTGSSPTARTVNYGVIANFVNNSSTGALKNAWILQNANGSGTFFGDGVYSNYGCEGVFGISAACVVDKGQATFNAGVGYWISGTLDGNGAELYKSASTIRLDTFSTGWPIILNSSGGVGINATPTANGEFNSALGGFFSGSQVPATGTGIAIGLNSGNGYMIAENFGTSTFQQLIFQGSQVQLAPNGISANGVSMISNELFPITDNQVLLGDTAIPHRFISVSSMAYNFGGSTSGNQQQKTAAITSGTITWPAGTVDFSATGGTSQVVKQTSAGGIFTVARLACADLSDSSTGCSAASGITAITGDGTATGPGSAAFTLATVNANTGAWGSATQSPQFTVNGKGLITAAANVTITPAVGSITGLGTGVATALGVNVGTAGSPVINGGVLGTPSSGVATNLTGTASGLTAGNVTTNANLTGPITSIGNATSIAAQTGTGTTFVMSAAPSIAGGTHTAITSLGIRDTSAAFDVTLAAVSSTALTAGRTLTFDVGNVAHTLKLGTTANTITFPNAASYNVLTDAAAVTGAQGGTGLTTAAIGDIMYASATTPVWARLADVATGSVLVSGGVNTAPAYSATPSVTSINVASAGSYQQNGSTILTTTGSATFTTSVGIGANAANTTGGNHNTAVGYHALNINQTGTDNTALGYLALAANNLDSGVHGIQNTAIGSNALAANTTGYNNVAVGAAALTSHLSGNNNMGVGQAALQNLTTGTDNSAIGNASLQTLVSGSQNTSIGSAAGQGTTAGDNTYVGYAAGFSDTSGANNIVVGANPNVNRGPTTGSNNILIGYDQDLVSHTASNQMSIANAIFGTGLTGTGTTIAGKIGILNNNPSVELDVTGAIKASLTLTVVGMSNTATTSAVCYNTGTGLLTYDGTIGTCTVSDERLKNMGARIANALDKLLLINGVNYTWKDSAYGSGPQIGVGAQTVERVFPELVQTGSDGYKSVDYQRLTAPIIEALRELKADNDNLREEVSQIKRVRR
jgi:hypothetical protein